MISKIWGIALLMVLACVPGFAVSTYLGLQPGLSTEGNAVSALGPPVRAVSATRFEHNPQAGTGKIFVEYRSGSRVIDRIEVNFIRPIARSAIIRSLNLSEKADGVQTNTEGQLMEYFGSIKSLVLTYTSEATSSGVSRLGYYSRELFERVIGQHRGSQLPGEDGENSTGGPSTLRAQYNPADCHDLYLWAQTQNETAKRSKDVERRQAILGIMIASQKGDCENARSLTATYKQRYR